MDDLRKKTVDTYNNSAQELADYFKGIGARVDNIQLAFDLAANPKDARIVEIGCGDGRDAQVISRHAGWFEGFDISEKLIEIARRTVPEANFKVADAITYQFPDNLDIIFAFASLLHLDRSELKDLLTRAHKALRPGGIFYISLKYSEQYEKRIKEDRFGTRLFYFYNAQIIQELACKQFELVKDWHDIHGETEWVEIVLRNR